MRSGHSCSFGNHFPQTGLSGKCSKRIPKVVNYLSTKAFPMDELVFFLQHSLPSSWARLGHTFVKPESSAVAGASEASAAWGS